MESLSRQIRRGPSPPFAATAIQGKWVRLRTVGMGLYGQMEDVQHPCWRGFNKTGQPMTTGCTVEEWSHRCGARKGKRKIGSQILIRGLHWPAAWRLASGLIDAQGDKVSCAVQPKPHARGNGLSVFSIDRLQRGKKSGQRVVNGSIIHNIPRENPADKCKT